MSYDITPFSFSASILPLPENLEESMAPYQS